MAENQKKLYTTAVLHIWIGSRFTYRKADISGHLLLLDGVFLSPISPRKIWLFALVVWPFDLQGQSVYTQDYISADFDVDSSS